ncbi:MAG: hypothetical protein AVDCRST_MAG76-3489 [uncultured Acidimicrobiales bacterium]|uniref:HNH nuclease domain-containing protein n=1 Tax=uncultured Acidimicrobiales bacterium TaxID=310071 RepID=A0A6J4J7T2_9ACTN|nr:MAG: hypothetical protein AVDCRST_MAG76-3489 [uncultured Acidimicrobiales bacterium]
MRDRLRVVQGELDRLLAEQRELVGELDARGAYGADGAVNATNWLSYFTGVRRGEAARVARVARAVRSMPATSAQATALGPGKVALLAGVSTGRTAEAFAACEEELVRIVLPLPIDHAAALLQRWQKLVDQDGADPAGQRRLRLSQTFGGAWVVEGMLDDEAGATVAAVVNRVADQLGRDDSGLDSSDRRSLPQRRADALVELVRRGAALADGSRGAAPLLVLCLDATKPPATATTPDGATTIGRDPLDLALCDSPLRRLVTDGPSTILDLGRTTRLVTPSQRLALDVRDGGCVFPGCARPPGWCDAHHLISWLDGGTSDLANLALLCRRHHRLHHHSGWTIHRDDGGGWTATHPTTGRTLHRLPGEPPHKIPLPIPA